MQPITIFCPFSRRWAVDGWLEGLSKVRHDPANTNLCIIVDGDEPYIEHAVRRFAEKYQYKSFHVKSNPTWQTNEVRLSVRRMRVADLHNQSKDLIAKTDGEIIIGLEDDTIFDRVESFDRLIEPLASDQVAFVEGVQLGRWGANMVGAWEADDVFNPQEIKTLLPAEGYQEITGGGWYGYATKRQHYLDCEYYTSSGQPWGPDVNYGFWLRQRGYKVLVDWETVFGHRDHNVVMYPDDPRIRIAQLVYNKVKETGKWNRRDYEPTRY